MNRITINHEIHQLGESNGEKEYVIKLEVHGDGITSLTRYSGEWTDLTIHSCTLKDLDNLATVLIKRIYEIRAKELDKNS